MPLPRKPHRPRGRPSWAGTRSGAAGRLLCLLTLLGPAALAAGGAFPQPFRLETGMTFYIVAPARDFDVRIEWQAEQRKHMPTPLVVRLFDPQETLLERHYLEGPRVRGRRVPWERHALHVAGRAHGQGVYQVVVSGMAAQTRLRLGLSDTRIAYGVYAHPDRLVAHGAQFADAYFYWPPGLDRLAVKAEGPIGRLVIEDAAGRPRLRLDGSRRSGAVEAAPAGDPVWRLSAKGGGAFRLSFGGLPVILCPDPRTARQIASSVAVLGDGTVCFHRFQADIHAIIDRYRQLPDGAFDVELADLGARAADWGREPVRNQLLLGPRGVVAALRPVLASQTLERGSPWFGSTGLRRADRVARNPLADYRRLGAVRPAAHTIVLAAVYGLDRPFNPYFRDPKLLNRIIIGELLNLMMLKEHELPSVKGTTYFGGGQAFAFPAMTGAFPRVIADCPPDVRAAWTEGLRRYVDRLVLGQVSNVVNQWTFLPRGIWNFHKGTGEPFYRDMTMRHIRWIAGRGGFTTSHMPAGYFAENYGPDGTYSGLSCHNLAWLYEETRDPDLLAAIAGAIRLLNHTVVPQPDGVLVGSSDWGHRTPGPWTAAQAGAGMGMLADDLPDAGLWAGHAWLADGAPRDARGREGARGKLAGALRYSPVDAFKLKRIGSRRLAKSAGLTFDVYTHHADHAMAGRLPVLEDERFTRAFGNEFFAIRRPAYYALIYAGRPMPRRKWLVNRRPSSPDVLFPRNGGGLSLFWSPDVGASLLGRNMSAHAAHTLVLRSGDRVDWEDYWQVETAFDSDRGRLVVKGRIRDRPLAYERVYDFGEQEIVYTLRIRAERRHDVDEAIESFGLRPWFVRRDLVSFLGRADGAPSCGAVYIGEQEGAGHVLAFDPPRPCEVRLVGGAARGRVHGQLRAALPTAWRAGQQRTFRVGLAVSDPRDAAATAARLHARLGR